MIQLSAKSSQQLTKYSHVTHNVHTACRSDSIQTRAVHKKELTRRSGTNSHPNLWEGMME